MAFGASVVYVTHAKIIGKTNKNQKKSIKIVYFKLVL